jgi:LacI family transcriptional regulator
MKRAGIHKIAKLARVSIGTVDRALHGRAGISESTRKNVLRIAARLAYTPHPAARALSVGRSTLRIGVCVPLEIHFFYDQVREGIADEARRARGLGVDLVERPIPNLSADDGQELAALLQSDVNAIILTPGNPSIVRRLIDYAEDRNVRVICLATDAPSSSRSGMVGVDPDLSGRLAAELMSKFVPPASRVAVVTGMLSAEEHRLKTEGFRVSYHEDCLNSGDVAVLEAHESEEESYRKTRNLLEHYPDLQGIYVATANCLPVCRALHTLGLTGKLGLITTDLFREMIPLLQQRIIHASIYQGPYLQGQTAVRLLVDHFLNGAAIPVINYLNPSIVLRTNLHLFREAQSHARSR